MKLLETLLQEWKELNFQGKFAEAEKFYYDELFGSVIENFENKYNDRTRENELLISMLGFSPEPLILTYKALKPEYHKIVVTGHNENISSIINCYISPASEEISVKDERFETVYSALQEIVSSNPAKNISIDITGGKKSTVAIAAIFARDFGCRLSYVDFSVYIKELRKPLPTSEILNILYDPAVNKI